eukprot:TRINITY_DN1164_c0_g1_i1.p1 TRINITY_DN1164_c0_g1~~TRINITY_DN1164_c0_g1_i1.p1  ORF type:complete len:386 (-),score=163.68 TRINITY_DN1164_c0_g1_i1:309-1415(-)
MATPSNGKSVGQAAYELGETVKEWEFDLHPLDDDYVEIKITFSGICHSDIHTINGDWGPQEGMFPIVPGHEIIGMVTQVGKNVSQFKVGDRVGVGPQAFSCLECDNCNSSQENYCLIGGFKGAYASELPDGYITKGGYATYNRSHQRFVVKIPDSLPSNKAAPLLCAGVTVYAPLTYAEVCPGKKVGVVGIGGLGHLGIKYAKAMGAEVTAFSRGRSKEETARSFGASNFVDTTNEEEMKAAASSQDVILNTTSANLDWAQYFDLLRPRGYWCQAGAPPGGGKIELTAIGLIFKNIKVMGSLIGSPKETQDMLNFSAEHNVLPDVEYCQFTGESITAAIEKVLKNQVRYRMVIEIDPESDPSVNNNNN